MNVVNLKKEINSSVDLALKRVEEALKGEGFGVLTRIDFHLKIKEKLNKDLPPTVILGACNPKLAFEIFQRNSDVTSLMPCNVVVRDVGSGKVSIEMALPTTMLEILGDKEIINLAKDADAQLRRVLEAL